MVNLKQVGQFFKPGQKFTPSTQPTLGKSSKVAFSARKPALTNEQTRNKASLLANAAKEALTKLTSKAAGREQKPLAQRSGTVSLAHPEWASSQVGGKQGGIFNLARTGLYLPAVQTRAATASAKTSRQKEQLTDWPQEDKTYDRLSDYRSGTAASPAAAAVDSNEDPYLLPLPPPRQEAKSSPQRNTSFSPASHLTKQEQARASQSYQEQRSKWQQEEQAGQTGQAASPIYEDLDSLTQLILLQRNKQKTPPAASEEEALPPPLPALRKASSKPTSTKASSEVQLPTKGKARKISREERKTLKAKKRLTSKN